MRHSTDERYDLQFLVITVSDTRTESTDESGDRMLEYLHSSGRIANRGLVPNIEKHIAGVLEENSSKANVFIFIGGTGLSRKDLTSRTLRKITEKEVTGFGETFRARSSGEEIHAILSDASMFVLHDKIIFSVPGSLDAQKTAFGIINEIVDHAYHEIMK
ncbi:MAG: molybdopterin-binding protein [Thermoplasmataceae archaeon]